MLNAEGKMSGADYLPFVRTQRGIDAVFFSPKVRSSCELEANLPQASWLWGLISAGARPLFIYHSSFIILLKLSGKFCESIV